MVSMHWKSAWARRSRFHGSGSPFRDGCTLLAALLLATSALAAPPVVTRVIADGRPIVVVRPGDGVGPWPVVFLMAGMGELSRGPAVSAAAWVDDYELLDALTAILAGKVGEGTFRGFTDARLLRQYRARVAKGYRGLVLVGVPAPVNYTDEFERYVTETLIPWAEATLPVKPGAAFRGIDGVSLGGRHALRLGLRHAALFRTIGTEQAAVRGWQEPLVELARASAKAARGVTINLLTSRDDPYRPSVGKLARMLRAEGLHVRFGVVEGPHNRLFNAGPGAVDLLLFHDAVLNGTCLPAPFAVKP